MEMKNWYLLNRVLLGLIFLVAGLMKLFVMGSGAVASMLDGLGFPAAVFFAWVLIVFEIVCGAAIIFNWQMKYTVWPPIIILVVATFTAHWANWGDMLIRLSLASSLLIWGLHKDHKEK